MVFSVTAYSASAIVVKRIAADIPALATTIEVMDRWRIIVYVKSLGLRK